MNESRHAILYRMVLSDHTCPYGIRAKQMLEEAGYEVEDCILRSREEVVSSTPQIFIGRERIGGSDELERYLIKEQSSG